MILHSAILRWQSYWIVEGTATTYIYLFCVPHGDRVCRRILHFQSPQAISLHLSPSDFTPGFYNPLTVWTHYTAHIINTAYNVFLLVILGSVKSALLIRIADTVCLLWNSVRICYRFSIISLQYYSCIISVVLILQYIVFFDNTVQQKKKTPKRN